MWYVGISMATAEGFFETATLRSVSFTFELEVYRGPRFY